MLQIGDHSRLGRESQVALSALLTEIAADQTRERISIADLMTELDDRAIAALVFVFAFPNALPMPPGASSILGAPLLFLTAQLTLGKRPWLPRFVTRRTIERVHFAAMTHKAAPWLAKIERLLRPRWTVLVAGPAEHLIGGLCFILAIILFLPIPLGNIPPAIAICLFSLALLERDGLWVLIGLGATLLTLVWVSGVVFALLESALLLFDKLCCGSVGG